MNPSFEKIVGDVLENCPAGTNFLVAVSGGADSMAMLAALCAVIPKEVIFCIHVEHGLRPPEESCGDADFVRDFCKKQGLSCRIESIPQGKIASYAVRKGVGIEAAARFFRRRALFREAKQLGEKTRILIAHTKDDMLELALMRIMRGAGPAGLAAMPVNRGKILRPLLSITRADVISYLTEKNILWREDSTNKDENFLRNKIRRRLIPLLDEFFPAWECGLSSMAETQSLTAAFLDEEMQRRVSWENNKDLLITCAENFFNQPQIIREEALFHGINLIEKTRNKPRACFSKNNLTPRRLVIRRFCCGFVSAVDLGKLRVKRESGKISISFVQEEFSENGFSLLIKAPGLYNLNNICIEVCPASAQETESSIFTALPVVLRQSFKDDFIETMGKKIKKKALAESRIISVVDKHGIVAFLGSKGILAKRELSSELSNCEGFHLLVIRMLNNGAGGTDV